MITIIQNEKHKELHRWISKSWSGHQSGFYRDIDPTAHGFGAERGLEGWGGVRDWIYFEELVHVLIEAGKVKTCHVGWRSEGELLAQLEPKDAYWQNPLFLREYQSSFLFLCVSVHMCVWVSSPVLTCAHPSRGQWSMWGFFLSHSILLFWDRLSVTDPRALCSC